MISNRTQIADRIIVEDTEEGSVAAGTSELTTVDSMMRTSTHLPHQCQWPRHLWFINFNQIRPIQRLFIHNRNSRQLTRSSKQCIRKLRSHHTRD